MHTFLVYIYIYMFIYVTKNLKVYKKMSETKKHTFVKVKFCTLSTLLYIFQNSRKA